VTRDVVLASLSDEQAVAATMFGEARGESLEGMVAVACVIRNRALNTRWWGTGYRGVCLQPAQFSCWSEGGPNTDAVFALAEQLILGGQSGERSVVSEIRWLAAGIVGEQMRDITRNADHYLTATKFRSPDSPHWAKGRVPVARIGAHVFFRLEL
jgi:N-acetylmuramoyl-L-alanine amidase